MKMWSTPSYVTYLSKRTVKPKPAPRNTTSSTQSKVGTKSSALDAKIDIKRKIAANRTRPLEKGIKITVGGP